MKYTDRGLVVNGSPNLELFTSLYWLLWIASVCLDYTTFPLTEQLNGNFPQNSVKGQICMKMDFHYTEKGNIKHRILSLCGPFLRTFFILKFEKWTSKFFKSKNLRRNTFAQFGGKHYRNIFTAKDSRNIFLICVLFQFIDNALIVFLQENSQLIDKETRFYIHNFIWVMLIDVIFGVFIPIRQLVKSRKCLPTLWMEHKCQTEIGFYKRQPIIVPRRDTTPEMIKKARENQIIPRYQVINVQAKRNQPKELYKKTQPLPEIDVN